MLKDVVLVCRSQDPTGEAASLAQKHLTFYELDLSLNHVVRKWSDPVDNGANLLIPVPGGADGPGGVLVCAENFIIYKNQDHEEVREGGLWDFRIIRNWL
jgi:splicing factor 3B subunit 3